MNWHVYWWKAGNQFLVGDGRRIVDLVGPTGRYFTIRYTRSCRPKTLSYICPLTDFVKAASPHVKQLKLESK